MRFELRSVEFHRQSNGLYFPSEETRLSGPQLQESIDENAYQDRLKQINDTYAVVDKPAVELAVVNPDKLDQDVILFFSTHFSSLSHNPGNAIELAAQGVRNPNAAIIYVAYPGNGGSHSFTTAERIYMARTGRLTKGDGSEKRPYDALDTVKRLVETVGDHGLLDIDKPVHVTGDESGARLGIAALAALPENRAAASYLNGPPGISHKANYSVAMLTEDARNRQRDRDKLPLSETDPGEVINARIKQARNSMPNIYGNAGNFGRVLHTYLRAPANVLSNARAFGGHDDLGNPEEHALIKDLLAALENQKMTANIQVNVESIIHDKNDAIEFGRLVMNRLSIRDGRGVRILIGAGNLDSHTHEPSQRQAAENYAFPDILRMLGLLKGRRPHPGLELPNLPNVVFSNRQAS